MAIASLFQREIWQPTINMQPVKHLLVHTLCQDLLNLLKIYSIASIM